jgi:hypothetical protein
MGPPWEEETETWHGPVEVWFEGAKVAEVLANLKARRTGNLAGRWGSWAGMLDGLSEADQRRVIGEVELRFSDGRTATAWHGPADGTFVLGLDDPPF